MLCLALFASLSSRLGRPASRVLLLAALAGVMLGGCDLTGAEAAAKLAEQREADGKAVGSACRHAGRAIEDCYTLNPKAQRSAIFAGWREMDEYMRENKLEAVPPSMAKGSGKASGGKDEDAEVAKTEAGSAGDIRPPKPKAKPGHS